MEKELLLLLTLVACLHLGNCVYECDTGQLRLVNGGSNREGRVEICRNGVWGTVSDYEFDMNDAKVVCRKLGYNPDVPGVSYESEAAYGQGNGSVFLGYLHCSGTEDELLDCPHENAWVGNDHSHDVGVTCPATCSNGALRLTGGYIPTEGTLEVCNNGAWSIICADNFQEQDGFVACRQLGYPATATQVVTSYRFTNGHGSPTWTNFGCIGNESALVDCSYDTGVCGAYNTITAMFAIVGLKCEGDVVAGNCSDGDIRLIGPNGANTVEGRIELCTNGAWGNVINDNFGLKDAIVACRQLGYISPSARVYPPSYFGDGAGPIVMNDVACLGSEYSLFDCDLSSNAYTENNTGNYATIKCWKKVGFDCTVENLRLSNGSTNYGRIEVCLFGEWGSICDNNWDRNDARVICKMSSFDPSYASFYTGSKFGDGNLIPFVLTDIDCDSDDNTLSDCTNNDQIESTCIYGRAAGVRCFSTSDCTDGEIRLWGGKTEREGELQICRNGVWGFVCDNGWIHKNARVLCGQMGYSEEWYGYSNGSLFNGNQNIAPLVYDRVTCTGLEGTLLNCTIAEYGTVDPICMTVAGVMCAEPSTCSGGNVRLLDGSNNREGRVEICYYNIWTTVDESGWGYNESKVLCRQMGYYDQWSVAVTGSKWGTGNKPIVFRNFGCDGQEGQLQFCSYSSYFINTLMQYWYSHERAGVACQRQNDAETCSQNGTIRLKDGQNSREGRLEICLGGYWGSVCSAGWTKQNTLVACRQLGYKTLRPLMSTSAYSGQGVGPVNLAAVSCHGNEDTLNDCIYQSGIGVDNCYHGNDVGLICSDTPASYYEISVTASPSDTNIPINTEVTLTCNTVPTPSVDVTYEWRSTTTEDPIWQSDSSSSTAKVTISHKHPKISYYYCAMKNGDEVLGIGNIKLSVKNVLTPSQAVVSANAGETVVLSVTQADTDAVGYLRNLQWYFHGYPVQFLLPAYSVSTDNLTLTLYNVSEFNTGQYYLQYDGLSLYKHSLLCEQETLELLREYPLFAPAVITLSVGALQHPTHMHDVQDSLLIPDNPYTFFTKDTIFQILTVHSLHLSSITGSLNWHEFSLTSFTSDNAPLIYVPSGLLSPYSDPHYTLDFIVPTILQSGYYEAQLTLYADQLLNAISCGAVNGFAYADFFNTQLGFTEPLVLGSAVQALLYYEFPSAQLTADKTAFSNYSNAQLVCSASGGYPLYYNITLMKNGLSIANTIGSSQLVYSTGGNQTGWKYGVYQCVVSNMIVSDSTTLLLQESTTFELLMTVSDCSIWDHRNASLFVEPLRERLQYACDCDLSPNTLTIDDVVCDTLLNVTTTLTYSSNTGDLDASGVLMKLYDQFDNGTNLTLVVGGMSLSIKWLPPPTEKPFVLPYGAVLALLFIAGLAAASFIFIVIIVVSCIIQRRPSQKLITPTVGFHVGNDDQVNITSDTKQIVDEDEEWELPGEEGNAYS